MTSPLQTATLIFSGGGTGGHLLPGIAVAKAWQERYPQSQILFAGSGRPVEQQILHQYQMNSVTFPFQSPRQFFRQPVQYWRNWKASLQMADACLQQHRPLVVVGLGGFASYPLIRQAIKCRIPVLLLEQNVVPGRATSCLAAKANRICTSYPETSHYLPRRARVEFTGNPLRKEILDLHPQSNDTQKPTLLIAGGSQGSGAVNQLMINFLQSQPHSLLHWNVRHQTGSFSNSDKDQKTLQDLYAKNGIQADLQVFFHDPVELYHQTQLVVCRAGGTTLAELDYLQIPALIIPISNAIRNHQVLNCRQFLRHNPGLEVDETSSRLQENFNRSLTSLLNQYTQTKLSNSQSSGFHAEATMNVLSIMHQLIVPF